MIRRTGEEGAAAVEFALVLPLLTLLLVGTVQFAYLFNQWQQLEHATREGARWASLKNSAGDVRSTVLAAAPGLDLAAGDIDVSVDPPTSPHGTPVTVSAQIQVPVFAPIFSDTLGPAVTLTGSATQRIE